MVESPWKSFALEPSLVMDGERWWALVEAAGDASAEEVLLFLEAAREAFPDATEWEPMFDPLLHAPGLADLWRTTREPLRSSLGHGLLRAGLVRASELPDGLCEDVASAYVEGDDGALLLHELTAEACHWPTGQFAAALRDAALATDEPVAFSLVRFAVASAPPLDAMRLALRAFTEASLELEPLASWGLLARVSDVELDALEQLAREWLADSAFTVAPIMRFRAVRVLLEHGRATERHDALLPTEMFEWEGDLPANPDCGLCGRVHLDPGLPHEPSPAVAHLLFQLPLERSLRLIERAEQEGIAPEVVALVKRWLTQGREAHRQAAAASGLTLRGLPESVVRAIAFAGSRLHASANGDLPRIHHREVLASFWPEALAPGPPDAANAVRNMRARVHRLLDLNAPVQVVMRDASRLRSYERLQRLGPRATPTVPPCSEWAREPDDESDRREVGLSLLVLRELAGSDPRFDAIAAQLERLRRGEADLGPNAAAGFEATSEASPNHPIAAVGHYAYCAIDIARGDHERTDQDDLYDIAERAIRMQWDTSVPAEMHSEVDAERRRQWWMRWLMELVPEALGR